MNLFVNEGEFYGFIGLNGVGKLMIIKVLLNFIYVMSGSVMVFGKDVVKDFVEIKKMVGYVLSEVCYYF